MALERLIVIFGYLPSDESSTLRLTLRGANGPLQVEGVPNPRAKEVMKAVVRKLRAQRKYLRGIPAIGSLDLPGGGNHTGGTFPMRSAPQELETDPVGRPHGLKRVHLVDSSVFPSLSAATITLTTMANAHRIASQSLD